MLKIKDNIDLKELEKFGFVSGGNENTLNAFYFRNNKVDKDYTTYIDTESKKIYAMEQDEECYRIYYGFEIDDLIKADLVEKVGD